MTATAQIINGRTAEDWEDTAQQYDREAARCYARSAESFDRCDTDGFLSQWASDSTAREYQAKAQWARDHGYTTTRVLLNLDGSIASTMEREGQYGMYWVLNDDAAERYGKRFVNLSRARSYVKAAAADARKGFKLATARVPGHAPKLAGKGYALSAWSEPQWDRVRAGEIEIIDADLYSTLQRRQDERDEQDAAREAQAKANAEPLF